MQKISSQDAKALLKHAGATIRNLVDEVSNLRSEVDDFKKQARVEKIAKEMEDKGLNNELTYEAKLAQLMEAPNLDVTEEAIKLAAPQMSLGEVSDIPGSNNTDALMNYVMTGEDL